MPKITTFFRRLLFLLALALSFHQVAAGGDGTDNSLLWRISGNGLQNDSYLYGTMHTRDERVFEYSPSVTTAFEDCHSFAMEVSLKENMYERIFQMMIMDESYSIHDYLSDADYELASSWFKKHYGLKLEYFERVKPVFLYVLVSAAETDSENEREMFLDEYFFHEAEKAGKPVLGIEKAEEQMSALDAIPIDKQLDLLMQSLKKRKKERREMEKLTRLYLNKRLDKLHRYMQRTSYSDAVYTALITARNRIMLIRIEGFIRENSVFIAVGAGHLPGQQGLISLLRQKGFEVEPVY